VQVRDDRRVGFDPGRQWAADGAGTRYGPVPGSRGGAAGGAADRDDVGRDARCGDRSEAEKRGRRSRSDEGSEDEGGGARRGRSGRGRASDGEGSGEGSGDDRSSKR
jgi:hypothetical protein